MVCKVRSGKNIKGALNYNEHKVRDGVAECIGASSFVGEPQDLRFYDKLARFNQLIEKNARAKTNCVHISLNFDVSEKQSQTKLNEIATTYMDRIGFGDQPYLVYQHNDAAHPHLHIVTTNIKEDGKRISIHNLGKDQSENARKEIEFQYGLVQAQSKSKQKDLFISKPEKVIYGKAETKRSISNTVSAVIKSYKFATLHEYNAVLRQYNVMADRGKEGMIMYEKNGLIYSLLNNDGNKIGVPIKASSISGKPTLKNLQNQFKLNEILKAPYKDSLIKTIDSFFNDSQELTKGRFFDYMNFHGINAAFRENKDGRVYGLTFIDNKNGVVFNGSDLDKDYSGQMLVKRFENYAAGEKERMARVEHRLEWPQREKDDHNTPLLTRDIALGILDLMKAEGGGAGAEDSVFKTRWKKKRGMSL